VVVVALVAIVLALSVRTVAADYQQRQNYCLLASTPLQLVLVVLVARSTWLPQMVGIVF
jgi:hypothetical protein